MPHRIQHYWLKTGILPRGLNQTSREDSLNSSRLAWHSLALVESGFDLSHSPAAFLNLSCCWAMVPPWLLDDSWQLCSPPRGDKPMADTEVFSFLVETGHQPLGKGPPRDSGAHEFSASHPSVIDRGRRDSPRPKAFGGDVDDRDLSRAEIAGASGSATHPCHRIGVGHNAAPTDGVSGEPKSFMKEPCGRTMLCSLERCCEAGSSSSVT